MLREVFYVTNDVRNFGDKFQALAIHDTEPLWEEILEGEGGGKKPADVKTGFILDEQLHQHES